MAQSGGGFPVHVNWSPTTFWVSYGSGGLGLFTVNLIGLVMENLAFHNIERISLRRWGMGAQS